MNRKIFLGGLLFLGLLMTGCHDLDLSPLSNASSENWYSSEEELKMAVNDLYRATFWTGDENSWSGTDWSDDRIYRGSLTEFQNATLTSQNGSVSSLWANQYKTIARANGVIEKAQRAIDNGSNADNVNVLVAEASFFRATAYAKLASHFGAVPLVEGEINIDEGLGMGRTDLPIVKKFVYDEYDKAIAGLPLTRNGEQRVTKGAAEGMKARFALYMGDYDIVVSATQDIISSEVYRLHDSYSDLFMPDTKNAEESLFVIPRSIELNNLLNVRGQLPRNHGGWAVPTPTWELFAAYPCVDGLPIDESPLFDPHDPFKNRDPRLAMTIVPFGSNFLGIEYNPDPRATQVMNYNTGSMIANNDTRSVAQYASYNGLIYAKGIDKHVFDNAAHDIEPDQIILRYADILLMYAEAKIELNNIDQSTLDAINIVRARAYGVNYTDTADYPAVTTMDQSLLRTILRTERRIEFANENLRYMDLIRWKLMDKVMTKKVYMMLYPSSDLIEKVIDQGDWFWPYAPDIDENGLADFTKMEADGKIAVIATKSWDARQYLWPIPNTEIQINPNMEQNPGY